MTTQSYNLIWMEVINRAPHACCGRKDSLILHFHCTA